MYNPHDLATRGRRNNSLPSLHLGADTFDRARQQFLAALKCFLDDSDIDTQTKVEEVETTMNVLKQILELPNDLATSGRRNSSLPHLLLGADTFHRKRQQFFAALMCFFDEPDIDAQTKAAEVDTTMNVLKQILELTKDSANA